MTAKHYFIVKMPRTYACGLDFTTTQGILCLLDCPFFTSIVHFVTALAINLVWSNADCCGQSFLTRCTYTLEAFMKLCMHGLLLTLLLDMQILHDINASQSHIPTKEDTTSKQDYPVNSNYDLFVDDVGKFRA